MKTFDPERERRLNQILEEAMDRAADERESYLREACGDDPALLAEVRALLEGESDLGNFLETPAVVGLGKLFTEAPISWEGGGAGGDVPTRVGPYRILELLGEGGMGRVFRAEQTEPVHRQVALKVVRQALRSRQTALRFAAERQALARLSHPNIARMYEAGTTTEGTPFFAMELVEGPPITVFSDEKKLSLERRLELFIAICRGVQHAHEKGILHRDIKPSNLLVSEVDGEPVPKIIDFGIAKALDQPLTEATLLTGRQFMGTPAYMSPEALQLGGGNDVGDDGAPMANVDTRTDVYALGVLLYELITGSRPHESTVSSFAQILRHIAEEDPLPPAARFRSRPEPEQAAVAELRGQTAAGLGRILTSDLGWIAMRAIARRPGDRYPSPAALAADVERHLRNEPVEAGPPTWTYRAGKFLRRNRGRVAAAMALAALAAVAVGLEVRSRVEAGRVARLSESLGREVERIEWLQRVAYQLPLQDLGGERERIRQSMEEIRRRMGEMGDLGRGPGLYALGRGALALRQLDDAQAHLRAAMDAGYQGPEVSLALGLTLGQEFDKRQRGLARIADAEAREEVRQQAIAELRDPARELLIESRQADVVSPELVETRIALYDDDLDGALEKSRQALASRPWLYEAHFLAGQALQQRAEDFFRGNEPDQALDTITAAEKEILAGLAIGRSDPEGHLRLCALRSLRLSLSLRYLRPDLDRLRQEALEACSATRLVDPDDPEAPLIEAVVWLDWAEVQIWDLAEDPTEALARAEDLARGVLDHQPREGEPHRILGQAELHRAIYRERNGQDPRPAMSDALARLEKALELEPANNFINVSISRILVRRASYELNRGGDPLADLRRAESALRRALEVDPDNARIYFYLSLALTMRADARRNLGSNPLEDLRAGLEALDEARRLDPKNTTISANRASAELVGAQWKFRVGEDPQASLERAIAAADEALLVQPTAAFVLFTRGHAFVERARLALARGEDDAPFAAAARSSYDKGLEQLPRIPGPYVEQAKLSLDQARAVLIAGQSPRAAVAETERLTRQALENDSERTDARRMQGLAMLTLATWQGPRGGAASLAEARRLIKTALAETPGDAASHGAFARYAWRALGGSLPAEPDATASGPPKKAPATAPQDQELLEAGMAAARKAQQLAPLDAEGLVLEGALLSLDPATEREGRRKIREAVERNPFLAWQWQPESIPRP